MIGKLQIIITKEGLTKEAAIELYGKLKAAVAVEDILISSSFSQGEMLEKPAMVNSTKTTTK